MKPIIILLILLPTVGFGQNYYLKYDSVKTIVLKPGKQYSFITNKGEQKEILESIRNDSFIFENGNYHFKEITALKNPKRKGAIAAIMYPLTIGSCVAVSTVPITYIKGYFLADTDKMFRTVGAFIVETMVFSFSRSYLSKNPQWVMIGSEERLDYREVK